MARLRILYVEGNGIERNLDKATRLLSKAVDPRIASDRYQLANMHEPGMGFNRDLEQAIRLYRQAANGGDLSGTGQSGKLSTPPNQRKHRNEAVSKSQPQQSTIAAILKGNW